MFHTLLVGTDGSPTAKEAVAAALELAAGLGAHVHLLSVSDDEAVATAALVDPANRARELQLECTTHTATGSPGRAIVEVAGQVGADLVVVGDRGMHGVNRLLTGSVPNHVAHNVPCSVLLIDSTRRAEEHAD